MPEIGVARDNLKIQYDEEIIDTPERLASVRAKFEPKRNTSPSLNVENISRTLVEMNSDITQLKTDLGDLKILLSNFNLCHDNGFQKNAEFDPTSLRPASSDAAPRTFAQTKSGSILSSVSAILSGEM